MRASRGTVLLGLWLLTCLAAVSSQQVSRTLPLSDFKNTQVEKRRDAYEQVKAEHEALKRPEVIRALVDLLDLENREIRNASPNDEGYAEYISDLEDTVADLADWHSSRDVCVLAEAPYDPESPYASRLAVEGGSVVVACLLKMARSRFAVDRSEAIPLLVQLSAVTHNLSPAVRQQIKQQLVSGLRDSSVLVRYPTVKAVGKFGTPDMIPILQDISISDPESRPVNDGNRRFGIREQAVKAIQSIRDRQAR